MTAKIQRKFIEVDGRQIHVRVCGSGAPVVLLHASPLSSTSLVGLIQLLSERYCVLAPDTPGYGLSDPLPVAAEAIGDYLPTFKRLFEKLGLSKFALYGVATGAQLAIEYSKKFPAQIELMLLDGACHFSDRERLGILKRYFPPLRPRVDGSHLCAVWHIVHELFTFFPWFDQRPSQRLKRESPPLAVIQYMAEDYLRAGPAYAMAYRAAFLNEHADRLQAVSVKTFILRWPDSILLKHTDALLAQELPNNVSKADIEPGAAARYPCILQLINDNYHNFPVTLKWEKSPARFFLESTAGLLHVRCTPHAGGAPRLFIHPIGGSMQTAWRRFPRQKDEPWIAFDLPGHGESESIEAVTRKICQQSAREIARFFDMPDHHATAPEPPVPVGGIDRQFLRRFGDLSIRGDGGHLLAAWRIARASALCSPWYANRADNTQCDLASLRLSELALRQFALTRVGENYFNLLTASD
jgi:pimeloyl-ACP methyl ester carboxylesterase